MISVIVPCRNEAGHIEPFLNSLLAQETPGRETEIIIADGLSDDGTAEILSEYARRDSRIRVIGNPGRIVSTGLNAAIRCARGDVVLRMDVHADYPPDYIASCVRVLEATGADNVGGAPRVRGRTYRERLMGAAFHSRFAVGGSRFHDVCYEGPVDTVCFGAWRKETLERVGLFDECLVRNQDDELNYRLLRLGGKLWQSASIVSWYVPRSGMAALWKQYFQYGFWKVAVIRKHGKPAALRHLAPGLLVCALVSLPLLAIVCAGLGWSAAKQILTALWLGLLAMYALACIGGALAEYRKHDAAIVALLPFVFPVYHLAYGTGFVYGIVHGALSGGTGRAPRAATSLSR